MKKNQGLIVEYACLDHAVIILVKSSKIGMLPVVLYGTWYFLTDMQYEGMIQLFMTLSHCRTPHFRRLQFGISTHIFLSKEKKVTLCSIMNV